MQLVHYVTASGVDVYQEWLDGLRDLRTRVRIARSVDRIRQDNFGDHKFERNGVWEIRLDFGPGYRIYLAKDGDRLIVLFGGGTKRGQQRDIDRAKVLHAEYKARKKAAAAAARKSGKHKR